MGFSAPVECAGLSVGEDAGGERFVGGAIGKDESLGTDGEVFYFAGAVEDVSEQGLVFVHGVLL